MAAIAGHQLPHRTWGSGKSSVLDAIDLCLGARRNVQFTDADFHMLDVEAPIEIAVTIGELDDALKSIEGYGLYLRGFDPQTGNRAGFGLVARLSYVYASRLFNCAG